MTDSISARLIQELAGIFPANTAYVLLYLWSECHQRGEDWTIISEASISSNVTLTKASVHRALLKLSEAGMITLKMHHARTIIHVLNLDQILVRCQELNHGRTIPEPQANHARTMGEPQANQEKRTKKEETLLPETTPTATPIPTAIPSDTTNKELVEWQRIQFDALWEKYPKRLGKKIAFGHFKATVKRKEDFIDVSKALDNYVKSIVRDQVEDQFIQHGSTWFNNWRDWLNYKPAPVARVSSAPTLPPPPPVPPEPTMTPEEMKAITEKNLKPKEKLPDASKLPDTGEKISPEAVSELVLKLAGGRSVS